MIILGLNEKLKGMQMLQAENKSLRQQIENDKKSRQDLQQSMRETTQQLHAAHEKQVADNEKYLLVFLHEFNLGGHRFCSLA